jgi:uncharacterized protein (DUF1684 family)
MITRYAVDRETLERYRENRDEFFRSHYASPLPDEDQQEFGGLAYFPPDSSMVFTGRFSRSGDVRVQITSSVGTSSAYHQMGVFLVGIAGAMYEFIVLDDGDGNPFIAFCDTTNGETTYAGGRYVSLDIAADGLASIDFDLATNPYCVYDEEFVCPLPPVANRIAVPVEAGEKSYGRT